LIFEPFISLCQCVVPNENHASYMGSKRRGFLRSSRSER
jgi:hypothetical protein